jgi:hypothetical protein
MTYMEFVGILIIYHWEGVSKQYGLEISLEKPVMLQHLKNGGGNKKK